MVGSNPDPHKLDNGLATIELEERLTNRRGRKPNIKLTTAVAGTIRPTATLTAFVLSTQALSHGDGDPLHHHQG